MVDDFERRRTSFDLMILSPKAAGVGLTILSANHVIHLSRWWNPAIEDQCNDRVYRIGAKLPVTIHIPMALHPRYREKSFDAQLDELVEQKRAISGGAADAACLGFGCRRVPDGDLDMRVFARRSPSFSDVERVAVAFQNEDSRAGLMKASSGMGLLAVVGLSHEPTPSSERGRLLGLVEFAPVPVALSELLDVDEELSGVSVVRDPPSGPHAVPVLRAWSFDAPLMRASDAFQDLLGIDPTERVVELTQRKPTSSACCRRRKCRRRTKLYGGSPMRLRSPSSPQRRRQVRNPSAGPRK